MGEGLLRAHVVAPRIVAVTLPGTGEPKKINKLCIKDTCHLTAYWL